MTRFWLVLLLIVLPLFRTQEISGRRPHRRRTKVLILGAGVAGLVAAKTLQENNVNDFLILDAQDYIGGRFKQRSFAGVKLEEGANWIHHADHDPNPLWEFKMKYNLSGVYTNYSDVIIRDERGQDITDRETLKRFAKAAKKVGKLSELKYEEKRPDMSLKAAFSSFGWKSNTPAERVIEYLNLDFEFGDRPKSDSLFGAEGHSTDFFVTDGRGYGSIFQEMAKPFKEKILLKKVVKKISYSSYGVTVTTTDGEIFQGDYGLCTFSTGVLASDMVRFSPKLPRWKIEAINKIPVGFYTKIFIKFPYKFWDSHEFILYAHRIRGYYPIWMDLDSRGILPGSAILHITVTEAMSEKVEGQSEAQTLKEIMAELRKVYGAHIPNAEAIFYSKWSKNPFTRGSYSNPSVGTTEADFHNLGGKLNRLFFAGEACDPDWWGYSQAAYFTGEKKAKKIAQCIKGNCPGFMPMGNAMQETNI